MKTPTRRPHGWILLCLLAAGCVQSDSADPIPDAVVDLDDGRTIVLSGPYTHENLALYLIHSGVQDPGDYITLEEGLKTGVVKVTEKAQEQVSELLIENGGDRPLLLQEGDRVIGGKQDRQIYASHVVPPRSGPQPLPAFCVEPGRWTEGAQGRQFANAHNAALAPKSVRLAGKVDKDQGQVWAEVGRFREQAIAQRLASNNTSSVNEVLEADAARKICDDYAALLVQARSHPDAVGLVVAVNGQVEEVNIYPNHKLLLKLGEKVVRSYAMPAWLARNQARDQKDPAVAEVCQFLRDAAEQQKRTLREELVNRDNGMRVTCSARIVDCEVNYNGQVVHKQIFSQSPAEAQRRLNAAQPQAAGRPRGRQVQQRDMNLHEQVEQQLIQLRRRPQQPANPAPGSRQ